MAAIVGTGLNLAGCRSEFFKIFDAANGSAHYNTWATRIASNKDIERYRWIGSVPPMREWGTGRKARGLVSESYDVENLKYEATLEVDRDEISDDQTGQIVLRIRELAQRAADHKNAMIATLLANGDQANFHAYDGKPFFATDHESGQSGVQSNKLTPAAVDADDPTAAEFKTAMKSALTALLSLKDDYGEPMNATASGLVAVVPPGMFITATEALAATVIDSTTNVLSGAAKVVPFARLTDASKWFLLKTDRVVRPFIFQDREPIELNSQERDSETGFLREVYLYGVRARYRLTYAAWQHAIQLNFTV